MLLALKADRTVRRNLFWRPNGDAPSASPRSSTPSALPRIGHRLAGSLSHGQKQWLEIGMLIAQDPKLLLVDEPVAGMTDAETMTTAELLQGHRQGPFGGRGRARHGVRAPARRQGDGAARRLGAGRRHRSTRSAPTSAWSRSIWGGDRMRWRRARRFSAGRRSEGRMGGLARAVPSPVGRLTAAQCVGSTTARVMRSSPRGEVRLGRETC